MNPWFSPSLVPCWDSMCALRCVEQVALYSHLSHSCFFVTLPVQGYIFRENLVQCLPYQGSYSFFVFGIKYPVITLIAHLLCLKKNPWNFFFERSKNTSSYLYVWVSPSHYHSGHGKCERGTGAGSGRIERLWQNHTDHKADASRRAQFLGAWPGDRDAPDKRIRIWPDRFRVLSQNR